MTESANSNMYTSNCSIDKNTQIILQNNSNTLYLGQGNNFTKNIVDKPECVTETNEVYTKPE